MNLKDYIVKKEFLSHNSKRCYKSGEIYNGGNSLHTKMLIKHGFIEEPKCVKKITPKSVVTLLALLLSDGTEESI